MRKKHPQLHGTRSTYVQGCRCEACTAAHRDYRRASRAGSAYADAAADPTSAITGRHVIADASYNAARRGWYGFACSCGVLVTAELDKVEPSRHLPLVMAWEAHKRDAARVRRSSNGGRGWVAA